MIKPGIGKCSCLGVRDFRVGDRVKVVYEIDGGQLGCEGIITFIERNLVYVRFPSYPRESIPLYPQRLIKVNA
jgi:hypothetical protein